MDKLSKEAHSHIKFLIKNVRYLMNIAIEKEKHNNIELVNKKINTIHQTMNIILKRTIFKAINWLNVYNESVIDGLIIMNEQYNKVLSLKKDIQYVFTRLYYEINVEIYHFMNRIYKLYPNLVISSL